MRTLGIGFLTGMSLLALVSCKSTPPSPALPTAAGKPRTVLLGSGDEIAFNVWRNPDMTRTLTIDFAGNVSIPLAGEIHAAGLTASQLKEEAARRLVKYLNNPQVDISVTIVRSQKYHVLGEVRSPGTFGMEQAMYVWEAIPRAGGLTADANDDRVLLVRKDGGQGKATVVNIRKAIQEGNFDESLTLASGDVVYVPPTKIASLEAFMIRLNNILNPILGLEKGIILEPDVSDVLTGKSGDSSGGSDIHVVQ